MKIALGISTLTLGCALLAAAPVAAQDHHDHDGGFHHSAGWHGGGGGFHGVHMGVHHFAGHDFAHFSIGDRAAWRGGHWWHGPWHGRTGWWWFAGGAWYFYDSPVYPYPGYVSDYYADDDYYDNDNTPDYGAPSGYSWYYCQNPPGYYPYVQRCNTQWQAVPAGAPQGYQSDPANQGQPPAYNNGPNGSDDEDQGPPPDNGPNGQGPNDQNGPPPGYGPDGAPPNSGH